MVGIVMTNNQIVTFESFWYMTISSTSLIRANRKRGKNSADIGITH